MKGLAAVAFATLLAGTALAATPTRPDFTGVWTNAGNPALGGVTNVAAQSLPIRPEAKARVEAYNKLVGPTGDSPGGWCLGYGMPSSMLSSGGYPMEIIQRPDQLTVIYEAHTELRHIYLGKRNAPQEDRIQGRNGYSSGHWEGNTLVVETDNLVDQVDQRWAHSDEATIVERYHVEDKPDEQGRRILVADMVMTDPRFYTAPVVAQKRWAEVPNGRLLPYECPEESWNHRLEELARKAGVPLP
ncbi:MAG: hypothetical protein RLZZ200_978 [Pseudomonadota bacterium]|jgi:hypothetical protein